MQPVAPAALYRPTAHGVHASAPAAEDLPAGHGSSARLHFARSSLAAQALWQYLPAWQASQLSQSPHPNVQQVSPREH